MSSCLYTVMSCRLPCCAGVVVADGDVNERSLSRETGTSSAERRRTCMVLILEDIFQEVNRCIQIS